MITVLHINDHSIAGHLGNQLFQVATAIGVAEKYNQEVALPNWKYGKFFKNPPKNLEEPYPDFITYYEPHYHYADIIEHSNINLHGYFQTELYFKHCENKVRDAFEFINQPEINLSNTTALHIRRGDYLQLQDHHPIQPMQYYEEAMELVGKDKEYLVFSNDIPWCQANFKGKNIKFSEGRDEIEDLYLMTQCENVIMANSSYSWWGAWLNKNKNKIIIAPKNYYGKALSFVDTKDLFLKDWVLI